jgi:hypothetical protein
MRKILYFLFISVPRNLNVIARSWIQLLATLFKVAIDIYEYWTRETLIIGQSWKFAWWLYFLSRVSYSKNNLNFFQFEAWTLGFEIEDWVWNVEVWIGPWRLSFGIEDWVLNVKVLDWDLKVGFWNWRLVLELKVRFWNWRLGFGIEDWLWNVKVWIGTLRLGLILEGRLALWL